MLHLQNRNINIFVFTTVESGKNLALVILYNLFPDTISLRFLCVDKALLYN